MFVITPKYKYKLIEVLLVLISFEVGIFIYFSPLLRAKVLSSPFFLFSVMYWFYAIFFYQPMSLVEFGLHLENIFRNLFLGITLAVGLYILWLGYLYLTQRSICLPHYGGSLLVVISLILIPLFEEFLFRGYAQNRLKGIFPPLARIILISIMLAGYKWAIHFFRMQSFLKFCDIVGISFVGSLICSYTLERTKSLITPIIIHIIWDSLVYISLSTLPWWMI